MLPEGERCRFFGAANSLRGYDENRFRGHIVGRALLEYRYLLGRGSLVYGFLESAYVRRPTVPGPRIQFYSRLGLVKASYALNDEDGPIGGAPACRIGRRAVTTARATVPLSRGGSSE